MKYWMFALVAGVLVIAGNAWAQPTSCSEVCVCEDAGVGESGANDLVCCATAPEGETPVIDDLQNHGEACGCAEIGPAGLIAGRAYPGGIAGCTSVGGSIAGTIDSAGPSVGIEPGPAEEVAGDCAATAVAACKTGVDEGCVSVTADACGG